MWGAGASFLLSQSTRLTDRRTRTDRNAFAVPCVALHALGRALYTIAKLGKL